MKLNLRNATIDDLGLLRYWDQQPHVIEAIPNEGWNWDYELTRDPDWREQLIAEIDDEPIGFVHIIDPALEDSHYWGNVPEDLRAIDIWIGEEKNLGKGYGTLIMSAAIDRCFQNEKVNAILIDPLESNVRAHTFYERLGFRFIEQRKFNEDDCFVYRLDRDQWNKK